MSLPARAWLPANALNDGVLRSLIGACVERWSSRWRGVAPDASIEAGFIETPTKLASARRLLSNDDGSLLLSLDEAALVKLGAAIIAAPAGAKPRSADIRLYRAIAGKALADLGQDLAGLLSCAAPLRDSPGGEVAAAQRFCIAFSGLGPRFDIYVANALALSVRRTRALGARQAGPLGRLNEAIGRQHVKVGARVGAARIGLADLYELGVGDVVVLDRRYADGVTLTIDGADAEATARIEQNPGSLGLRLFSAEQSQ